MLKSRNDNTSAHSNSSPTSSVNQDDASKEEALTEVALDDEELKLVGRGSGGVQVFSDENDDIAYDEELHPITQTSEDNFSFNSEHLHYSDALNNNDGYDTDTKTSTVTYNNTPVKVYNSKSFPQQQQQQSGRDG